LAAIPDQDDLERAAVPGQDALAGAVVPGQDAAEPGSAARLPAAKQSEARSRQEDVVIPDLVGQEVEVTLDQVYREVSVIPDLGAAVDHQARWDEMDDQEQREHRARRCNTRFRRELMPYVCFYSGVLVLVERGSGDFLGVPFPFLVSM
jgi:hypothetical protein